MHAGLARLTVDRNRHGIPGLLKGVYEEDGPPTDDADIMLTSLPLDVLEQFHISATEDIAVKDKVILDDLQKAGFKIKSVWSSSFDVLREDALMTFFRSKYPGGLFLKCASFPRL